MKSPVNQAGPPSPDREAAKSSMQRLWGSAVSDQSGFVAVPVSLLKSQRMLGLSTTDLVVLVNLLAYRWTAATGVFPRNSLIAKRMGVSDRTVQRSMTKLLASGLARRMRDSEGRRVLYFDPLVRRLSDLTPITEWKGDSFNDA